MSTEKHPSYALLQISRITGSPRDDLFGSSIIHNNFVALRIYAASQERSLYHTNYFGHEEIIELWMSPSQFAEAITSLNAGRGVPATIVYKDGKKIEGIQSPNPRQQFVDEFQEKMSELVEHLDDNIKFAQEILEKKGALTKDEKKKIIGAMLSARKDIKHNIPFIHKSFDEAMDKTALEAKGEVEAFINNAVIKAGYNALQSGESKPTIVSIPQLTSDKND